MPSEDCGLLVPVIMAGGAGTRFWPLSTPDRPKQFLRLFGDRSLLRMSFERAAALAPAQRVLVLTNRAFVARVREEVPELPPENVVGEPVKRDTAAAVALAALLCERRFEDPVMAILTADHLIEPPSAFREAVLSAADAARASGALYTFGVIPTRPATEYGYLEKGRPVEARGSEGHFRLARFKEKPTETQAKAFLDSGRFLWNSGMFVWKASAILDELRRQLPGHVRALAPASEKDGRDGFEEALRTAFEALDPVSVDHGVMEGARDVRCIAAEFSWEDVGGWAALASHLRVDGRGNAVRGNLLSLDASGNIVFCEPEDEEVALIGVSGLVVVRAGKTTFVAPKARADEIKALLRDASRKEMT